MASITVKTLKKKSLGLKGLQMRFDVISVQPSFLLNELILSEI